MSWRYSVEGVRLEWNTFIGIFENLEKKNREIHAKTRE